MMGTVGVVVVSYNSAEDLPSCLAGVAPRLMRSDGATVDSVGQVLHPVTLEVRDRGYGQALRLELLDPQPVFAVLVRALTVGLDRVTLR